MPRNIDTNLLRAFVAVAEMGGMTAAAGQLHLTQAAISQQIRRLEEQFGVQLFIRGNKGMSRTALGDRLYGRAKAMLALNDEIWTTMTRPEFEGEICLGVPHDIVTAIIPGALRSFDMAWPKVQVTLDCSATPALLRRLEAGTIDLILTTESHTPPHARRLLTDRLAWVGALDGQAHRREPLPIALGDENCAFRPIIRDALTSNRIDWRMLCETQQMQATEAMIRADIAIGAFLASTLPDDLTLLPDNCGLPRLPIFYVNMYLPRFGASEIAVELASHIEEAVAAGQCRAA